MKQTLFLLVILLVSFLSKAQTVATDFTTNDCNSISHHLFSELDSGKVIVVAWVMPCSFCVDGAKAGWTAKQNYETSNPGRVRFYLVSDFGDDSCSALASWASTNNIGIGSLTTFPNVGKPINMTDYGTAGMPKVVVLGGSSHYVYFNKNFSPSNDPVGISNAIAEALVGNAPTAIKEIVQEDATTLSFISNKLFLPNIESDEIVISNINGQIITKSSLESSKNYLELNHLTKGMYFVHMYNKGKLVVNGKFIY